MQTILKKPKPDCSELKFNLSNSIININVLPWNIYGNIDTPDLKTPLNVMADGREWYNSFMPPFFDFSNISLICGIKDLIDSEKDFDTILKYNKIGKQYSFYIDDLLSKKNKQKTVADLSKRVSNYFNFIEKRLISLEPAKESQNYQVEILAYLYVSINMMQLFMDPVETFIVGKKLGGIAHKDRMFGDEEYQVKLLEQSVPLDIAFIPLSVVHTNKCFSSEYQKVFDYMTKALFCTVEELEFALDNTEKIYNYAEYLDLKDAQKLVKSVSLKIDNLDNLNNDEFLMNELQLLSSCMTWSKYIPTQLNPLRFRYYTTNEILLNVDKLAWVYNEACLTSKDLEFISNSGAEKQGKLICILHNIFKNNKDLKDKVLFEANILLSQLDWD